MTRHVQFSQHSDAGSVNEAGTVDTPSKEMARSITETVTDARGREIEVRKLKPHQRMMLLELIGGENAMNGPYLGYATLAYSVSKIDGVAVPVPRSKLAIEAMVQKLDDDGLNAVGDAVKKLYPNAGFEEQEAAVLKNE